MPCPRLAVGFAVAIAICIALEIVIAAARLIPAADTPSRPAMAAVLGIALSIAIAKRARPCNHHPQLCPRLTVGFAVAIAICIALEIVIAPAHLIPAANTPSGAAPTLPALAAGPPLASESAVAISVNAAFVAAEPSVLTSSALSPQPQRRSRLQSLSPLASPSPSSPHPPPRLTLSRSRPCYAIAVAPSVFVAGATTPAVLAPKLANLASPTVAFASQQPRLPCSRCCEAVAVALQSPPAHSPRHLTRSPMPPLSCAPHTRAPPFSPIRKPSLLYRVSYIVDVSIRRRDRARVYDASSEDV